MKVFLDKAFIHNYWDNNTSDSIKDDFQKEFLRKSKGFTVITNYSSLEEIMANDEDFTIIEILFEGVPHLMYGADFSKEGLKTLSQSNDFKLFFIDLSEGDDSLFEMGLGYLFVTNKSFGDKWSFFMQKKRIEYITSLPADNNDEDIFNEWDDLSFISKVPNHSIFIVDKYILSDKTGNKLSDNLIPLLEHLLPQKYNGVFHISILSEKIMENEKSKTIQQRAETVHRKLNTHFARYKDRFSFKFTIIHYNPDFNPSKNSDLHDRYIYTNYFTIESPKGFDLFKGKERKLVNSKVTVHFNFERLQAKVLNAHMEALRNYKDKMERMEILNGFKTYPREFKCPLLN